MTLNGWAFPPGYPFLDTSLAPLLPFSTQLFFNFMQFSEKIGQDDNDVVILVVPYKLTLNFKLDNSVPTLHTDLCCGKCSVFSCARLCGGCLTHDRRTLNLKSRQNLVQQRRPGCYRRYLRRVT